ncbi:MAG: PAS domain-containing sensor histidine kinase [Betaproteobacteria bacterium]|nr:PAS domain-containing sensor histidine kinase [Betaproteobacteria bacterium]MDH5222406.1 PAS domain-containing sensor histidine kinase [Betaproteobacteria bacterium]MDH5351498.1 PAS domain-containing sensor histidine kinase [Betaproteobacteria bacterium]
MSSPSAAPDALAPAREAPARAEDGDRGSDPRKVLADRVEQLYSQMPLGIVFTLVIGAIATYELWDNRTRELVMFWWGLVLLVTAARTALWLGYRKSGNRVSEARQWLRWLAISALANGANWGFAGAVFFPSHTDEQQVFLAFLLAGIASAGIPTYAASWPMFAMYAGAVVLPFAYVLANFGNRLFAEIALLVPLFYLANVGIAYRLNQVFHSGYRLRHAYGRLTEDYTTLNKRLERQLVELDEARRQVEASGRKLALFAERAPIAVLELDNQGRIQRINHAAENLFGWPANEVAEKNPSVRILIRPEYHAEFDKRWQELMASRVPLAHLRVRNPRRDGLEVVCEWNVTPLVNPEGEIVGVIAQGQDITRQMEADQLKKEFTSTLSHELRTPLTSIIGSLQLINSGVLGEVDKDIAELTGVAERNGQRLLDLINDILDIEKIESGKLSTVPEVLSLDELVRESLVLNQGFAERFHVRFQLGGALLPVKVNADRKRLLQVMTNLLSNAAKFSPQGEAVEVTMEDLGERVRVSVLDRGPGIPESFRSRIFGRFAQADSSVTRQKGGTGLGLAICKRLIELMDGRIGFAERERGGTVFHFDMPKHAA